VSESSVFKLAQPGSFMDPLTEVLRHGAQTLLAQAVEAEVAEFLDRFLIRPQISSIVRQVNVRRASATAEALRLPVAY